MGHDVVITEQNGRKKRFKAFQQLPENFNQNTFTTTISDQDGEMIESVGYFFQRKLKNGSIGVPKIVFGSAFVDNETNVGTSVFQDTKGQDQSKVEIVHRKNRYVYQRGQVSNGGVRQGRRLPLDITTLTQIQSVNDGGSYMWTFFLFFLVLLILFLLFYSCQKSKKRRY